MALKCLFPSVNHVLNEKTFLMIRLKMKDVEDCITLFVLRIFPF